MEQQDQLPEQIIVYILSFLPLRSLFRFKCVCKLWNTLFLHPHFLFLWRINGLPRHAFGISSKMFEPPFEAISWSSQGLTLDKPVSAVSPLRYRVQCITTFQALAIPNPQNPSMCIALEFVPSNQAVKLVSVHEDEQNEYSLGYEILAVGIGMAQNTRTWRAVKVAPRNLQNSEQRGERKKIEVFFRREVAYCIWYVETEDDDVDIEVDVFDMVNESYIGHTTFPRGQLSSANLLDWNGQLSFAQLVKDELHVLVFDDYRKLRWAETTRIIKLTFLKPDNELELFEVFSRVDKSILSFIGQDKKSLYGYNIYTGELAIRNMDFSINSVVRVAFLSSRLKHLL